MIKIPRSVFERLTYLFVTQPDWIKSSSEAVWKVRNSLMPLPRRGSGD